MAEIKTLVRDIYTLFNPKVNVEVNPEHLSQFSSNLGKTIANRLKEYKSKPSLRMSNIGDRCKRKLWYNLHTPDDAEHLQPHTYIKFLFGDILEELLLLLAKVAGHDVQNVQESLEVNGIKGHCDATIDGVLVDVKSASSQSFTKFEQGLNQENDSFGYLTQLGLYSYARDKNATPAGFLAIDKQNGHITLDMHGNLGHVKYEDLVETTKKVATGDHVPPRGYVDTPEGKSGNMKLGVACSYCPFKFKCWPNLKAYYYARGPVYLTRVVREPRVSSDAPNDN